MLRATIYVTTGATTDGSSAGVQERVIRSYPVTNRFDFEVRATNEYRGARVEFGPISEPWRKL
jgi:hypothetical protein